MASNNEHLQINWKGLILGTCLAGLANVVYLSNIFAVGHFKLAPFEVGIVKGIFQTAVFTLAAMPWSIWKQKLLHKGTPLHPDTEPLEVKFAWCPVAIIVGYGVSNALMTVLAYVAIRLLPLSDCVVFGHTAPVFTLLLSFLLLRSRISIYKVCFCVTLIVGVVLVARPTFLFGNDTLIEADQDNATEESFQNTTNQTSEEILFSTDNYLAGVIVTLLCALSGAFSYVTSALIKPYNVSNSILMVSSGVLTFLLAFLGPAIGFSNRFMSHNQIWEINFNPTFLLMVAIASGSIFGGFLLIFASQVTTPTVISVVRASEIVLALFVDRVILGLEGHGPLQIVGSFVVLSSIVGMTFSDWLESKNLCKSKAKVQEDVEDVEKNENSESLLKNNET